MDDPRNDRNLYASSCQLVCLTFRTFCYCFWVLLSFFVSLCVYLLASLTIPSHDSEHGLASILQDPLTLATVPMTSQGVDFSGLPIFFPGPSSESSSSSSLGRMNQSADTPLHNPTNHAFLGLPLNRRNGSRVNSRRWAFGRRQGSLDCVPMRLEVEAQLRVA
ncbi:hypothetical protein B0T10DRAFT_484729 [Thelonectria olida]|uniref:Uncharacterized protein n=1 Tax=Thelonectria olida TaxID=1576542 RepID=A0A9P9AQF4_9HYPO|nr:hypothetical protein B0T10DRAFT_484729 [Thelonectria olida]